MRGKIILDHVITAREYTSLILRRGETLRVIDLEGKQVADLVALSREDRGEKLSCVYSNILNSTWKLTRGHILFTNRTNPIFTITEDKVGLHYSGGGFCSETLNHFRYRATNTRNCEDNLTMAFKPYGINRVDFDFDCCFNIFMNLTFQPDGSMKLQEPLSQPDDYIDLRAEMDCIVAISNCPQDRNPCNGFKPTPLQILVFDR
ncbi:MAG: DUF1989 domain-containing protein [Deltaproteobacteria bacterium]|nr:DUF1989 domain-containing protein [Deltaproteobacteria bacterium]